MNPGESVQRTGVLPQDRHDLLGARDHLAGGQLPRHDLHEGHAGHRVEEVQPEDPRGLGRRGGDGLDRERAGVGRQDRVAPGARVERSEDLLFQAEVLEGRLDDQLRFGGDRVQGPRFAQSLEAAGRPRVDRVRVQVEVRGTALEPTLDAGSSALDGGGIDVVEDDLGAGFERHLRDAGTHRARTHDADDRERAARGRASMNRSRAEHRRPREGRGGRLAAAADRRVTTTGTAEASAFGTPRSGRAARPQDWARPSAGALDLWVFMHILHVRASGMRLGSMVRIVNGARVSNPHDSVDAAQTVLSASNGWRHARQ